MNPLVKKAIDRFDKAAQEYAFRGTWSGSPRYNEVCAEYHDAKSDLQEQILKAIERAFKNGQADIQSRHDYPDTTGR